MRTLGSLSLDQMDGRLLAFAKECDMVEATHDWEQQYGNLNEEEMLAGVVYEVMFVNESIKAVWNDQKFSDGLVF